MEDSEAITEVEETEVAEGEVAAEDEGGVEGLDVLTECWQHTRKLATEQSPRDTGFVRRATGVAHL